VPAKPTLLAGPGTLKPSPGALDRATLADAMRTTDRGAVAGTPLARFAGELVHQLRMVDIPSDLTSEADLERRVLIPRAAYVAAKTPGVRLFVHPFRKTDHCQPNCETARGNGGRVVLGCPRCWHASKPLWSVAAFGSHHTFDLVAADDHERLAVRRS
jgi:hypothetical protein